MFKPSDPAPSGRPLVKARVVVPDEPRWLVLVMLFVLMGALAIPMLWRSPHFSRPAKRVLSVLAFLQTIVVLVILALVIMWFVGQVSTILSHR